MQLQFTPIIMEHWCPSFLLDEIVTTWINFYWVNPKLINSFSLSSHSVFCNIHDIVALALGSHPCELKRFDKIIWYQLPGIHYYTKASLKQEQISANQAIIISVKKRWSKQLLWRYSKILPGSSINETSTISSAACLCLRGSIIISPTHSK